MIPGFGMGENNTMFPKIILLKNKFYLHFGVTFSMVVCNGLESLERSVRRPNVKYVDQSND